MRTGNNNFLKIGNRINAIEILLMGIDTAFLKLFQNNFRWENMPIGVADMKQL